MDAIDLVMMTAMLIILALVLVLVVLVSTNLQNETTGAATEKNGKMGHLNEDIASRDERERALRRKEHENFMNYDGDEQMPIDVEMILTEYGKRR